jgi:spermidine synthase
LEDKGSAATSGEAHSAELCTHPGLAGDVHIIWLHALFFLSGFPALLYQIVWQRALFAIYGVNIQSVTIVVSAFMLGLGAGSLLGGLLSKTRRVPLLLMFGLAELGIGAFGSVSLGIFHWAAIYTAGVRPLETGIISFSLLVAPTALMGCTLPILVVFLVRVSGNVGRSVGSLYCVNTLGSAAACFMAALVTMRHLGQSGSVYLAVAINCTIGSSVLIIHFLQRGRSVTGAADPAASDGLERETTQTSGRYLSLPIASVLTGLGGFIALAYEILWYRAYSYTLQDHAPVFPALLGFYLTGIAFGSYISRALCRQTAANALARQMRMIAGFVVVANLLGFLVLPSASFIIPGADLHFLLRAQTLPLVGLSAALLGATFPLISHASVRPDEGAGSGTSLLYAGNIAGSTLGSFLVGCVLMDYWTISEISVGLAVAGLALGGAILIGSDSRRRSLILTLAASAAVAMLIFGSATPLFDGLYERLEEGRRYAAGQRYRYLVETKSGVIAVEPDGVVLGGGVYDGAFNIDLVHDKNGIERAYSLSLWHPSPRRVLMIGLSSGSWAQVIANHPQVEKFNIVEINPGYLRLIPRFRIVSSLLENPKASIVIDDGRRWLFGHPNSRFDVIVMNTTFNWRAHTTNLLSVEFLRLARRHLNPGGVLFYNTTGSPEVQLTGVTVFPYGLIVRNCLAVSDAPIAPDVKRWERIMMQYRIDGVRVLDPQRPDHREKLSRLISEYNGLERSDHIRERTAGARVITDDNMGTEWQLPYPGGLSGLLSKWWRAFPSFLHAFHL